MTEDIFEKLKRIPFMSFDYDFDFNIIKDEVIQNNIWHDYIPPYFKSTPELVELHQSYKQCALSTIYPSRNSSNVREHFARWKDIEQTQLERYYDIPINERNWYYTDQAEKFPNLLKLIANITDKPILCKIVKSGPGHFLGWHSHQNDPLLKYYNLPEQCIIHLPIITNPKVAHIVTKEIIEDRYKMEELEYYINDTRFYVSNFTSNKLWFFNSFYQHAYKNYSNEIRIDILLYNDMDNNIRLREFIENQIEKYNGVLIK